MATTSNGAQGPDNKRLHELLKNFLPDIRTAKKVCCSQHFKQGEILHKAYGVCRAEGFEDTCWEQWVYEVLEIKPRTERRYRRVYRFFRIEPWKHGKFRMASKALWQYTMKRLELVISMHEMPVSERSGWTKIHFLRDKIEITAKDKSGKIVTKDLSEWSKRQLEVFSRRERGDKEGAPETSGPIEESVQVETEPATVGMPAVNDKHATAAPFPESVAAVDDGPAETEPADTPVAADEPSIAEDAPDVIDAPEEDEAQETFDAGAGSAPAATGERTLKEELAAAAEVTGANDDSEALGESETAMPSMQETDNTPAATEQNYCVDSVSEQGIAETCEENGGKTECGEAADGVVKGTGDCGQAGGEEDGSEGSGDDDGEDSDGLEDDGEAETTSSEYADPLGRIAELEDEIKLLNTCCKHYSNGKAAAERRVNELETEIHRLENDLNVKQHEALKSSRRHEAEVQKLHADLGTANRTIASLQKENESLRADNEKLRVQVAEMSKSATEKAA